MRVSRSTRILDDSELTLIHDAAMRFLRDVGIRIEHPRMLTEMEAADYVVDRDEGRVIFPAELLDEMVENTRRAATDPAPPQLVCHCGGSPGFYFDPRTETVVPHTTSTITDAIRLADFLPEVDWMNIMGFATDVPPILQLLFHKLITWDNTRKRCSANEINDVEVFPYYLEFCEVYCNAVGRDVDQEARAVAYTAHPFRIREGTAERYYRARDAGLSASLSLGSVVIGLNAPVTLAGAVTVATIVGFLRSLVSRALSGGTAAPKVGSITGVTSAIDVRTARVGKAGPEVLLAALAISDIARFYGTRAAIPTSFQGQGKRTQSFQTGWEKGAFITNILAGAETAGAIGCISQPEHIFSPMQLILDAELVAMFRRFQRGFEVTPETIGYEVIKETSETGVAIGHPHTARHHREELWQGTYTVNPIAYDEWLGRQEEFGYAAARQKALEILDTHHPNRLPPDLRHDLAAIIKRASTDLTGAPLDHELLTPSP